MAQKLSVEEKSEARRRYHIMMMVEAGTMTATDAAAELGLSRTAFYEWQNAATGAALEALTEGKPGRPRLSEETCRIRELEKDLEKLKQLLFEERALSELKDKVIAIRDSQLAEREKKRK